MNKKLVSWLFIGSGLALIIGSMLPWATVQAGIISASINGTSGDGKITLVLGIPLVVLGGFLLQRSIAMKWVIGGGVISLATLILSITKMIDLPNPGSVGSGDFKFAILVQIGMGLWLCLLASIVGVLAAGLVVTGKVSLGSGEAEEASAGGDHPSA